jgi:hypothetical protein
LVSGFAGFESDGSEAHKAYIVEVHDNEIVICPLLNPLFWNEII